MTVEIRIIEGTSLEDVASWVLGDETQFLISQSANFQPGAQGLALSALRYFLDRDTSLEVRFDFGEPLTKEDLQRSLLGTAFGFSIARLSRKIFFGKPAAVASDKFKSLLASSYRSLEGCLAIGKTSRSLLAIDPQFQVPPRLGKAEKIHGDNFPQPSVFQREVQALAEELGFRRFLASHVEAALAAFIYEVFRNTLEHGVPVSSSDSLRMSKNSVRSTRALILERVSLRSAESVSKTIAPRIRNFLSRVAEDHRASEGAGVLCVTIADQGDGIQATLPSIENESAIARLERAFREGESRKPVGEVRRGLGLSDALTAAFGLGAMLQICSDGIIAWEDYSTGERHYPGLALAPEFAVKTACKTGTSISLFVPEFSVSPDQAALFSKTALR